MDKTPISVLQHICAQNGVTARFELVSVSGVVHSPTFMYSVQVSEYSALATGHSKKKAKHAVAQHIIKVLINESDFQIENADNILQMLSHQNSEIVEQKYLEEEESDVNPVGKLEFICKKRHWCSPHYETINEEGLPHERIFKMKCIIENMDFNETGVAKSKRLAKRNAAQLMIKRLKDENLDDSDELTDKFENKKIKNVEMALIEDWIKSKSSAKVNIAAKDKIDNFYNNIDYETNEKIDKLISDALDLKVENEMGLYYDKDYIKILKQLTQLTDSSFKVITVPQLNYSGFYQCLVHMIPNDISYKDLPVLTSWGASQQLEDAKQTAAGNAIKLFSLLKITI